MNGAGKHNLGMVNLSPGGKGKAQNARATWISARDFLLGHSSSLNTEPHALFDRRLTDVVHIPSDMLKLHISPYWLLGLAVTWEKETPLRFNPLDMSLPFPAA